MDDAGEDLIGPETEAYPSNDDDDDGVIEGEGALVNPRSPTGSMEGDETSVSREVSCCSIFQSVEQWAHSQ